MNTSSAIANQEEKEKEKEKEKKKKTEKEKELSVGIFLSDDAAQMPTRAYANDVGYDLYAIEDVDVLPGTFVEVKTGVHLSMPSNMYAQINTRSGHGKKGAFVHHGVIDPGYTGHITLWVMNIASSVQTTGVVRKDPFTIAKGDKIAQLLFHKAETPKLVQIKKLPTTERGDKGHGSSGR